MRRFLLLWHMVVAHGGSCTAWRNTGGCNPRGPREPASDRDCNDVVPSGASGYCECSNGAQVMASTCDHPPFVCETECGKLYPNPANQQATVSPTGDVSGKNRRDTLAAEQAAAQASPSRTPPPSTPPVPPQAYSCVGWRQTHGCDPDGRRDHKLELACSAPVPSGASGYCVCTGATDGAIKRVRLSTCDHPEFTCAAECARASHYDCDGWRQTGNCTADGPREDSRDLACNVVVPAGVSGFCECGGGARRVPRPSGCSAEDLGGVEGTCGAVCARGESLYEMLGIAEGKDASDGAIKQAFRRLSLKLHPDKQRTQESKEAASVRFSEVRIAYDVLSDPDAKILYDMHGHAAAKEKASKQKEGDNHVEMSVTLAEVFTGKQKEMTISRRVVCKGCSASSGGSKRESCRRCGECPNEVKQVNVQVAPGFVIPQQQEVKSEERCEQRRYVLDPFIPKGTRDGDTITFARAGEQRPGRIPGDVVVKLKVQKDKWFKRSGKDLHTELAISLKEALLGFTATITHLDGHTVQIKRTGVTKPNMILQIRDEGITRTDADGVQQGEPGSLFVKIVVNFPDSLGEEAKDWAAKVLPS